MGQTINVSVTGTNGFTGAVSVSATALPPGVTVSPASTSIQPGTSGMLTFSASGSALIGQQTGTIEAASGALKVDHSVQIDVTGGLALIGFIAWVVSYSVASMIRRDNYYSPPIPV